MYKRILVAVDGSDHARRAVHAAGRLAELFGSELTLVHVVRHNASARLPRHLKAFDAIEHSSKTQEDLLREAANEMLDEMHASIAGRKIDVEYTVAYGHPAQAIVQQAENNQVDLIVMGTRGLSDLKDLLLGSVSHRVTQLAHCSVLLVK